MTDALPDEAELRLLAAKEEGRRDYHRMRGEFRPPYPFGTREYNAYENEWKQALKRASSAYGCWTADQYWCPEPPEPTLYKAPKENEYARRKG
ncbi:hypothetical protein [Comamonas sp. GB3 AK4-5]|uniref:hypothetical protein n=1 Tax=Comamonas sp. GB3 AK4-5 TaxID=3231487 RepID=UPI00351E621A